MNDSQRTLPSGKSVNQWLPLGVMGLVAVLAGLVLPQVLPLIEPAAKSASPDATAAKTDKNDWTYVPPAWPEPPNHQAVFLRLGLGTVAVLALCAGTLWCCKRWLRGEVAAAPA